MMNTSFCCFRFLMSWAWYIIPRNTGCFTMIVFFFPKANKVRPNVLERNKCQMNLKTMIPWGRRWSGMPMSSEVAQQEEPTTWRKPPIVNYWEEKWASLGKHRAKMWKASSRHVASVFDFGRSSAAHHWDRHCSEHIGVFSHSPTYQWILLGASGFKEKGHRLRRFTLW